MLLKSLKLLNFRQFKGEQEVIFATDEEKNVTVIMGENASGKTTLAQAFSWCLYGDTEFDDKSMLNIIESDRMLPNEEKKVRVELSLKHRITDYTILREQAYKKEATGKLKSFKPVLNIRYRQNGQQEFILPQEVDLTIKQILPKELSHYFFFDGERIGKMSKEIRKGRSKEFSEAVRRLLGLNAILAALNHLKPTKKNSVIGIYNESYDSTSDINIARFTKEIDEIQKKLDNIDNRLIEIDEEISFAEEKSEEFVQLIHQYAEGEKLQKNKENLSIQKDLLKKQRVRDIGLMMTFFNYNSNAFFIKSMIEKALNQLSKTDKIDKGIPNIHSNAIKFLIERGYCVCGSKIESGNIIYNELKRALEYLPPQSIGLSIGQFLRDSEIRIKSAELFFDSISSNYSKIREYENTIDKITNEVTCIEEKLKGMKSVSNFQNELMKYEGIKRNLQEEKNNLNRALGELSTKMERADNERKKLTLRDKKNRRIEIYKAYAHYMYDNLSTLYEEKEKEIREKLQYTINEIFRSIYEGGMSLTIDEKYCIQVIVNESDKIYDNIETSTAQSISVIFAFIAGIIKMARNSHSIDSESKMLEAEPYPLVMDAPLSAFDKRRIKTVCETLPKIAEQVIIFIKDTDGEIAELNMSTKIGKRYLFDKKNELETFLMGR